MIEGLDEASGLPWGGQRERQGLPARSLPPYLPEASVPEVGEICELGDLGEIGEGGEMSTEMSAARVIAPRLVGTELAKACRHDEWQIAIVALLGLSAKVHSDTYETASFLHGWGARVRAGWPLGSVRAIAKIERLLLRLLDYRTHVSAGEFAWRVRAGSSSRYSAMHHLERHKTQPRRLCPCDFAEA